MTDNGWQRNEDELTDEEKEEIKELAERCWVNLEPSDFHEQYGLPETLTEDNLIDDMSEAWWDSYPQYAEYANNTLPELRRIAGYDDSGIGTYQINTPTSEYKYETVFNEFSDQIHDLISKNARFYLGIIESTHEINISTNQQNITATVAGIEVTLDNTAKKMINELKIYLNTHPIGWVEDISVCYYCKRIVRNDDIIVQEGGESYCSEECQEIDNQDSYVAQRIEDDEHN